MCSRSFIVIVIRTIDQFSFQPSDFHNRIKQHFRQCSTRINFATRPPGFKGRLPVLTGSRYADLNFYQKSKHEYKKRKTLKKNSNSDNDSLSSQELTNFDEIEHFPGCGKRHHVAWSTPLGDVRVDAMVKIYDMLSVQVHHVECDNRGM